jgi:heme-degrading monooxygenase HmoA
MASTPWTALAAPDGTGTSCTVVAVQLRLRTPDAAPAVDTWMRRVTRALPAPGLLGFMTQRTEQHLRTVSAWQRRAAMAAFEREAPHRDAKHALHELLHPPTVAVWTEATAALPPDWQDVRRRLNQAADRQHSTRPAQD